ncbi:SusC/RagA family TonB-linked outer membrane protein [Carboxylicivirga taeanensis]|uniref:SusC/RagA family TonB-linked outer membrane protein n=1 Tax=Carboxylicivirga taeanensis TaxID=1416875 RepID=UPI003F6E1776
MRKKFIKPFRRLGIYLLLSFLFLALESSAQAQVMVRGTVVDEQNEPVIGAAIIVENTTIGTIVNIDGRFELEVPSNDVSLLFTCIGFVNQTVPLNNRTELNIVLKTEELGLDEVVVVGYGTQKRASITGAVSQINGKELEKAPVANVSNMLGGLISGVITNQTSGQPGSDAASISIRGEGAKYIVDGVERDFNEIDPNEIATISVLKDAASASVYGLDANAVVIVTTKRGRSGASRISFTGGYGISSNANMLEMLDGPGYAYWYNKAREMDGDAPVFTSKHIEMMLNNDPSDGWGNTNWYKEAFGVGTNSNFNLNASGGSEKLQYFVSLGTYSQKGNLSGFNYDRINIRSNIDARVANNLDLTFDISGRIEDRNSPAFSGSPNDWNNIPQQALRAHPYVPSEIDGIPVSTRTSSVYINPIAAAEESGYKNNLSNKVQTNLALNYEVPFIKGLSAKFLAAYDINYQTSKNFSTPYQTYVASLPSASNTDISYSLTNDPRGNLASLGEGLSYSANLTTNTSLKYEGAFGKHSFTALALVETKERTGNKFAAYGYGFPILELDELDFANIQDKTKVSGTSYNRRLAGYLARVTYDFDQKYMAEVSMRYDGSDVFGGMVGGKRWSPFPAASAGWRISQEDWFANNVSFINNLKLRAGVGLTGTTEVSPYTYLNTMQMLDDPAVILGGSPQSGMYTSKPGNINLTWAKALQYNAGIDAHMWNGLLAVEFDVFYKFKYDMLSSLAATYPPSFGGYVFAYENNNEQEHKGFEVSLTHTNRIGDFHYRVGLTGTYTKRTWLRYGDSENTPDWLKVTGKEVGAQVGFIADGLFQSQEEIDNSPTIVGKDVRVGDIRYRDLNGDGVISYDQDRGFVGKSGIPKFVGGINLSGGWKNLDFSIRFAGALGRDIALTGVYHNYIMDHTSMSRPFYHGGNSPKYLVENSWREDNRGAEFPRLSLVPASSNNGYASTYWYRNGDYLRLKNMQIGYSIPKRWIERAGIGNIRVYAEGQNLFTLSHVSGYGIDPEAPGVNSGYYPQQRVMSVGVKLDF